MKKLLKGMLGAFVAVLLLTGSALAMTYTYGDTYKEWPGYHTPRWNQDVVGNPQVSGATIYIDESGYLDKIVIGITNRVLGDALFIGSSYQDWSFYVYTTTAHVSTLYSVEDKYEYTLSTLGRVGHPSGIKSQYLTADLSGILVSVLYDGQTLTYDFNFDVEKQYGIYLGESFSIGYTPYCANDVFLTPEPTILMLIGFGLIGLGAIRRKFGK